MRKPLKTNFKVWDRIFTNRIHCYIGYLEEELKRLLKSHYNFTDKVDTDGFSGISIDLVNDKAQCLVLVIWLRKFDWTIDDMDSLIHEISHTIDKMFCYNNIPLTKDTGEFRAILMGAIYGQIVSKINKLL